MKQYASNEVQDLSSRFRSIAKRLCHTDYSQCDANLKRFMNFIESEALIASFIKENNIKKYDIETICKTRDWLDPFEVSADFQEEISLEIQLLRYSIDHFDGDFTRLYETYHYIDTESTVNDEMKKFIEHIIDPLIDAINDHLHQCFEAAVRREGGNNSMGVQNVSANNSTIVIGSTVGHDISNQVAYAAQDKKEVQELIATLEEKLEKDSLENKNDIKEILQEIKDGISNNTKPKKGVLIALKTLCQGGSIVIPLVTALIELISKMP